MKYRIILFLIVISTFAFKKYQERKAHLVGTLERKSTDHTSRFGSGDQ